MDEKTFELIEKMYSELVLFRKESNERFDKIERGQVLIEEKLESAKKALFDGYEHNTEAIEELKDKVDALAGKVDKQEVEIRVIKGAK
mgnify:FL=1